jgi:hypothetical protein
MKISQQELSNKTKRYAISLPQKRAQYPFYDTGLPCFHPQKSVEKIQFCLKMKQRLHCTFFKYPSYKEMGNVTVLSTLPLLQTT